MAIISVNLHLCLYNMQPGLSAANNKTPYPKDTKGKPNTDALNEYRSLHKKYEPVNIAIPDISSIFPYLPVMV